MTIHTVYSNDLTPFSFVCTFSLPYTLACMLNSKHKAYK